MSKLLYHLPSIPQRQRVCHIAIVACILFFVHKSVAEDAVKPAQPVPAPAPAPAPALAPAPARIEVLHLSAREIGAGGELIGAINLAPNGDVLRLIWIDEAGRVCAAQEWTPVEKTSSGPFTFKMPPGTFGHRHKLALVRIPPNAAAAANMKLEALETFRVIEPILWDDYVVLSTDDSASSLFPSNSARMEPALLRDENPLFQPGWDLRAGAYAKSRDVKLFEREPPLFDEAAIQKAAAAIARNIAGRASGHSLWSLGDGADISNRSAPFDFDTSLATLDMFHGWLQNRYGSLKLLNTEWRTSYTDWDKIVPLSTDEMKAKINTAYAAKMTLLKKGDPDNKLERRGEDPVFTLAPRELHMSAGENVSAWADFRAFNDFAFARVLREFRKIAVEITPGSQCGLVNAQPPSAWGGWDYQNIGPSVDWVEEHGSFVAREILRGMSPQTRCITAAGGQDAAAVHRLWDRWLRGDSGCLLAPAASHIAPPLDDIQTLARGITLLRNQARPHADPIAIYYSPRSVYLHWMMDSEADGSAWLFRDGRAEAVRGSMDTQYKSWLLLLEDLGYAPYFIHPESVAAGALHFPETRVVILPKVLALSRNEANGLRDFVKAGGCVIADGECGTFDGLGKRRGPLSGEAKTGGTMDVDFGIARKDFIVNELDGRFKGDSTMSRLTMRGKDGKPFGPEAPELRILEPGVSPSGSTPHAGTSNGGKAMFSKPSGSGRYFYLNICLQDYVRLRAERTAPGFRYIGMTEQAYAEKFGQPTGGEALRLAVSDILDEMVGENPLSVKWESGALARNLKRVQYDLGSDASIVAVMPLAEAGGEELKPELKGAPLAESATALVSDGKSHSWYDIRRGEYLGTGVSAKVKIEPNRPALLAALPYAVEKVALKIRRLDQGHIFKVGIDLAVVRGTPIRHVFHVGVFDPAGNPMPYYTANVLAEGGSVMHQIALGINDPPGTYRVKVRDVLSGKIAEGELVKEGADYSGLKFEAK